MELRVIRDCLRLLYIIALDEVNRHVMLLFAKFDLIRTYLGRRPLDNMLPVRVIRYGEREMAVLLASSAKY